APVPAHSSPHHGWSKRCAASPPPAHACLLRRHGRPKPHKDTPMDIANAAPVNEPVQDYRAGSPERAALASALAEQTGQVRDIPMVIGGTRRTTRATANVVMPHNRHHTLARVSQGDAMDAQDAIRAAAA